MTFDGRLANVKAPVVHGLYFFSQILIKKDLRENTAISQG